MPCALKHTLHELSSRSRLQDGTHSGAPMWRRGRSLSKGRPPLTPRGNSTPFHSDAAHTPAVRICGCIAPAFAAQGGNPHASGGTGRRVRHYSLGTVSKDRKLGRGARIRNLVAAAKGHSESVTVEAAMTQLANIAASHRRPDVRQQAASALAEIGGKTI